MTRWISGLAAFVAVAAVACSNDASTPAACPDETTVGSGAACSTSAQTCAGSVDIGACPGQSTMLAEYECTCTSGKWSCPQPAAPMCPADGGADAPSSDGAPDAPNEASTGDDAGDAATE
jgi:hypothetical protein